MIILFSVERITNGCFHMEVKGQGKINGIEMIHRCEHTTQEVIVYPAQVQCLKLCLEA